MSQDLSSVWVLVLSTWFDENNCKCTQNIPMYFYCEEACVPALHLVIWNFWLSLESNATGWHQMSCKAMGDFGLMMRLKLAH